VFACAADSSDANISGNLNELVGRYGITVNRDALFSIVQQARQLLCPLGWRSESNQAVWHDRCSGRQPAS
jgi:hypothetical protein